MQQLGRKKCAYLSMIDLRDAFHTLRLALSSQKYCGITPYYGSPTYHYLRMGMGMSVSPQIWQQFIDLVFQDDLIKHKQNFDVIMDDTFIHLTVKRKRGRPPKPKPQIPTSNPRTMTAAKNLTTRPRQHPRSLNNEIVSRQMINEINVEQEKSDRLTVAKLNTVKQFNKQDHKSKLMTEKYLLLPLNPQQLTPVQTAIQRMSEKHPDFEIEPVNTI